MFKALKYLLFAGLYQKAKKSFFVLFGSIIALILLNLIISDVVDVSDGITVYVLLIVKWIANLSILGLIGFSILKIINAATDPFTSNKPKVKPINELDSKKDRILAKETLLTKSDVILEKYMKGQQ